MDVKPGYKFERPSLKLLLSSGKVRIFLLENLYHNWDILEYFREDDWLFIMVAYNMEEFNFRRARERWDHKNKVCSPQKIIFLGNTEEQVILARKYGFSSVYCNHNCWLKESVFVIKDVPKEFDLVLNCRPEKEFKRPQLSALVENKAIIKGKNYRKNDFFDMKTLNPRFINDDRLLTRDEVIAVINRAYVGGIFSEQEGACWSSGEYLLCGLPVVSTYCRGGRETWYNGFNSILVPPDERKVLDAVMELKRRVMDDPGLPSRIRQAHVEMAQGFRLNFCKRLQEILDLYNIPERGEDVLRRTWAGQYAEFMDLDAAVALLRGDHV